MIKRTSPPPKKYRWTMPQKLQKIRGFQNIVHVNELHPDRYPFFSSRIKEDKLVARDRLKEREKRRKAPDEGNTGVEKIGEKASNKSWKYKSFVVINEINFRCRTFFFILPAFFLIFFIDDCFWRGFYLKEKKKFLFKWLIFLGAFFILEEEGGWSAPCSW